MTKEPDETLAWQRGLAKADAAPRCGARRKSTGTPCRAPAMPNGRCRVHGGPSTGPRTPEGLERSRKAAWKHGRRSAEAVEAARLRREASRQVGRIVALLGDHGDE
jgi:hypothetical protein